MNVTKCYFTFTSKQIDQLKTMAQFIVLRPLLLNRTQLLSMIDSGDIVKDKNLICLPLLPDQFRHVQYCQPLGIDIAIDLSYHQLQLIAKINFDINIDISNHIINHQKRRRVFKNKK